MNLGLLGRFVFVSWCVTTAGCPAVAVVSRCCQLVKRRRRCLLHVRMHLRNKEYLKKRDVWEGVKLRLSPLGWF